MKGIGVIPCARGCTCSDGKCFEAPHEYCCAFSIYSPDETVGMVGYSTSHGLLSVVGTHPISQKYVQAHASLFSRQTNGGCERTQSDVDEPSEMRPDYNCVEVT